MPRSKWKPPTPPETWEREEAAGWAAVYASKYPEDAAALADDEAMKEAVRIWLNLNDEESLIDEETGLGVKLGPPRRMTTWDVKSMTPELIIQLAGRGVLTVSTTAFDALVKAGGGSDLDEAKRFRIDGESQRPVQVVAQ